MSLRPASFNTWFAWFTWFNRQWSVFDRPAVTQAMCTATASRNSRGSFSPMATQIRLELPALRHRSFAKRPL
jgi:hypothetical protein